MKAEWGVKGGNTSSGGKMAPRERVRAAIARHPSDKIPKGEFKIERGMRQRLLQRWGYTPGVFSEQEETWLVMQKLGMDLMGVSPVFPPRQLLGRDKRGRVSYYDFWGNEVAVVGETPAVLKPACCTWEELQGYKLPAVECIDFGPVEEWSKGPFFVFLPLPGPFGLVSSIARGEDLLLWLAGHEKEMGEIAEKFSAWLVEFIRRGMEAKADGVVIMEDLAGSRGLFMVPDVWRKVFYPLLAVLVREVHRQKAVCFFHSDGDIRAILDDLIATGVDGIHSLEPASGMDLGWLKREYGAQVCLMGNIDCRYLLPCGTPEEVEEATRYALAVGAPGGGFILSSAAGVISADWPVENIEAMYLAAENYGSG